MPESISCRGCGRRVVIPARIDRLRARCPKCRTRLTAPAEPAVPVPPDAYQTFISQGLELAAAPRAQPQEPLELPEEEVPSQPLPDGRDPVERPEPPAPEPARHSVEATEPAPFYPPPYRFPIHAVADTGQRLGGPLHAVLTPHGLFLEKQPNRPLLFIPPGTPCKAERGILRLHVEKRRLSLRIGGIARTDLLAADIAAFLAGQRPVPLPAEYRRPWWLAGIGLVLALALAAGPLALTESAGIGWGIGAALAAAIALAAGMANAAIALFAPLPTGAKVASMAGASAALLGLFWLGAARWFPNPEEPNPNEPREPAPVQLPPTPAPSESRDPPTWLDLVYRDGTVRLDDGAAEVTALAAVPGEDAVAVGYSDGSVRVWPLDQAFFEAPRLGPSGSGAVHRIDFSGDGRIAAVGCAGGLVVAPIDAPPREPLLIPGEQVVAFLEPKRERFAAIRKGRIQVRLIPMNLMKPAPERVGSGGFVTATARDETLPVGFPKAGQSPPGGPISFLAWHPNGSLLCGHRNGYIQSVRTGGPPFLFGSREHKAAVRAWAVSPFADFATGDDDGFVGYWPRGAKTIARFQASIVPIKSLSFNLCGGELAVLDQRGLVSVWDPVEKTKLYDVKRNRKISAMAFGPRDDLLLLADGKGVEIVWTPELAERGE